MPDPTLATEGEDTPSVSKVAALDIGSNSFHLVVARIVAQDVQVLHQLKLMVQLADGLDENDCLSEEAMSRGLENLAVIGESLKDFEPDSVRVVATHTLRKATNARKFIRAAKQVFPYPIETISGVEEARLIYLGVAHTSHHDGSRLVVDIGGGSTELIMGKDLEPQLMRSVQVGCVTLTKQFFAEGKIKPKSMDKAIAAAQQELEEVDKTFMKHSWKYCIGSSGTIRAVMLVAQELCKDAKANHVTKKNLDVLVKACSSAGHIEKLTFDGLSDERRRVFPAGLAILTAAFQTFDIDDMEFSPAALREGVIYDMEERLSHFDIRERTAQSLATRYAVDVEHAQRVLATTMLLYEQTKKAWSISKKELRAILGWAALLHEVGLQINSSGVQKHSAYILQNVELPGFNEEQQRLLATLVRFQRKKIKPEEISEFALYSLPDVGHLIALLRLGVLLNFKRQSDIVPEFKVKAGTEGIALDFPNEWLVGKPVFTGYLEREQELVLALEISLKFE